MFNRIPSLRSWPLWLILVALVPRLLVLGELRQDSPTYFHPEGGDSILYDAVAAGAPQPARIYFHSPLYQWFLDAIYVFGRNLTAARLAQHLGGCAAVLLVWWVTRQLWGPGAAAAAGVLQALFGPGIFFESQLLVDGIMPFLVAGVPALVLLYMKKPRAALVLALGAALGVGALARAVVLIWAPILALWLWRRNRRHALLLTAAVVLPIAPVTLRNYLVEREFVLITANGGLNLYVGNNPQANGAYVLPEGLWFQPGDPTGDFAGFGAATAALGHRPRSGELSRWWSDKALTWMAANPSRATLLAGKKLALLVNDYEYPQLYNYYGYRLVCPMLRLLPTAGWVIVPALLGLALAGLFTRRSEERLLALLAIAYAFSFTPFFVVDRYRCAWIALLSPFAGLALMRFYESLRARRWAISGALSAGLVLSAGVSFAHVDGPTIAPQLFAFGEARLAEGDTRGAIDWYTRAAAIDPRDARVQANLGMALGSLGRFNEARLALERAAEVWPGSEQIQNNLGIVYQRLGRLDDAERAFRTAIQLNPALGEAYAGLGALLADRGDLAQARAAFQTALQLAPPDSPTAAAIRERAAQLVSP